LSELSELLVLVTYIVLVSHHGLARDETGKDTACVNDTAHLGCFLLFRFLHVGM